MGDEVWSYTQDTPGTSLVSGARRNPFVGKWGEAVIAPLFGEYVEAMARGLVFSVTTLPAGTAIPVNTTTAPTFILWNPLDSGKIIVPITYRAGFASGTGIAGGVGYEYLASTGGAKTGTSAVITAFTDITPVPGLLGSSFTSAARFATTATVVTTTASFLLSSGLSQGAPITSTASYWVLRDDFNGAIGLKPGSALYTVANTAIAEVTQQSLTYLELPL